MNPLNATTKEGPTGKLTHYLSVVAIFKNESHCIKEWIEHYIREGVDHFYLIDNGSTDSYKTEIEEFIQGGSITLVLDDKKWAQVELYNKYFLELKDQSEWLVICDLDEFVYARNGFETISGFLRSLSKNTSAVRIPWKMFGSSGLIEQPTSIINSFTKRASYEVKESFFLKKADKAHSKAIVRSKYLRSFHMHFSYIKGRFRAIGADKKRLAYPRSGPKKNFQPISEKILERSFLHLNHYAIQSKSWFMEVKATRGDAHGSKSENVRNLEYFESRDKQSNDVIDNELSEKRENTN